MESIFDTAKQEIREMVELGRFLERFDSAIMKDGLELTESERVPIEQARSELRIRYNSEIRFIKLLKKYT